MIAWLSFAVAGTVVDTTGRSVTADPDDTLVVLSGGLTESVFALGLGARVIGVDSTSVFPQAATLPQLGYYRQLSAEGILSLGPDLVLAPDDTGPPGVLDQIRAAGVRVAVVSGTPSVDGAKERLRTVGALLDRSAAAEKLVAEMERTLATVSPSRSPRVLFVYARSAGAMQVAGRDTAADAMITLAGGQNAVQDFTGYRPLTAEGVVAARPDVILLTDRGLVAVGGVDAMVGQPGVALTPAGAARRVVSLDDLLLLGFGPRTGDAVVTLEHRLSTP